MSGPRKPFRWPRQRIADAQASLDDAHRKAAHAEEALREQEDKLEAEQPLHRRLDQLDQANHLAALVWEIVKGGGK